MILQGSLRIEFNEASYELMVKTILKNGVYYFFVSDKEKGESLLHGKTLELTYSTSFCEPGNDYAPDQQGIPPDIIGAVQKMLLENKELWYY